MIYGYTIADKADRKIFEETIRYMESLQIFFGLLYLQLYIRISFAPRDYIL